MNKFLTTLLVSTIWWNSLNAQKKITKEQLIERGNTIIEDDKTTETILQERWYQEVTEASALRAYYESLNIDKKPSMEEFVQYTALDGTIATINRADNIRISHDYTWIWRYYEQVTIKIKKWNNRTTLEFIQDKKTKKIFEIAGWNNQIEFPNIDECKKEFISR